MSNLLKDASILLTPTAYDNSSMLSIKPENGDGDFDFSRNSAATRVNAQGLVENVQIISSELVSNGDFSQEGSELITNGDFATDSDWNGTNTNGVTISNGSLNYSDTTLNHNVSQGSVVTIGKSYKVTLTVSNYVKGSVLIIVGAGGSLQEVSSNGTFTMYGVASINTTFYFQARGASGTTLTIDNVSVKEVGQNWENTFGSQWTFDGSRANLEAGGGGYLKYISGVTEVGKKYRISYVTSGVSPTNRILFYGINNYNINATTEGVTEGVFIADGTYIRFRGQNATADISIESVSVKEITDDTNLPRIDYTDGCGVWLLEPQSTNLIPYSEDFSQWTLSGDTTIESGYLAPDGTNNAYKISGTDNNIKISGNGVLGTSQRTIFARTVSGTGTAKLLTHRNNTNNLFSITEQWQRFEVNSTTDSTSETSFFGIDFRGGSLSQIILWGANATNDQNYATSYIPTNGATSTRLQDIANNSGNCTLINSTEGVLYAEMAALENTGESIRAISLGVNEDVNQTITIRFRNQPNVIGLFMKPLSPSNLNLSTNSFDVLNFNKIALKYKSGEIALWINGSEVITSTNTLDISGLNYLSFDHGSNNFCGKVKAVAVFKEALTDAQLQCLTTI